MVSLVVEQVHERGLERMSVALPCEGSILDARRQAVLGQAGAEVLNRRVGRRALATGILEVGEQLLVERADWKLFSREATEPRAVGEQKMIQCAVNRAEERLAIPLALLVGDRRAKRVEPLVHPTVVPRHHAERSRAVHGCLPLRRALSGDLL